jgi:hypothetical protein
LLESIDNDVSHLDPGDIMRGIFLKRVYDGLEEEKFDLILTAQLHADGLSVRLINQCYLLCRSRCTALQEQYLHFHAYLFGDQ